MSYRIFRLVLAVLAAVILMAPAGETAMAGDAAVKAGQTIAPPAWPTACRLAMKHCRIIRTCRTEHVSDCATDGKCKLRYQLKRVCRCRVICRWPHRPRCVINAQCPNDV
ncbi:MAG: hypothetical protein KJ621_02560 [Proteobacteria bacterium]|nr:hypothetical protein [Pseudomonadota bacterium]MBU1742635.1 hypothetical protein [Pseudomonadota bacterium]